MALSDDLAEALDERPHGARQTAAVLLTVAVGGWLIVVAKSFLVPLVLASFTFILVQALDRVWGRITIGGHRLPPIMTTFLSATFLTLVGATIINLVAANAGGIAAAAPGYQARLTDLVNQFETNVLGLDIEPGGADLSDRFLKHLNVAGLATQLASGVASAVGNLSVVLVYLFFLLLERPFFERKMALVFRDNQRRAEMIGILQRIDHDVSVYLGLKSLVSLLTALPAYGIMLWVGLDFAEFWALLIFALNFIPNVGSLVATVLPSSIALVQFDTLGPFAQVALGITSVQLIVANVVEPNLLGRRLNMSPLLVITALVGWSMLWGVPGAFLCVPMTNIALLILANVASTRWIAVLLSRDGALVEEGAR
ncbi:MAG: AI-2E family transporter [Planctomycetota bacterium]|nr:AI-2E family transporter [Planctomycetota bacterium]